VLESARDRSVVDQSRNRCLKRTARVTVSVTDPALCATELFDAENATGSDVVELVAVEVLKTLRQP